MPRTDLEWAKFVCLAWVRQVTEDKGTLEGTTLTFLSKMAIHRMNCILNETYQCACEYLSKHFHYLQEQSSYINYNKIFQKGIRLPK